MLRITLLSFFVILSCTAFGQETLTETGTYAPDITEVYHVLKADPKVKQGLYQAFYRKKTVIAMGMYNKGEKAGMWHYYNAAGKVIQHYNFDKQHLLYSIADELSPNQLQYEFLPRPADTDSLTLPVKVGGILYGYARYINKFKVQNNVQYVEGSMYGILQILVSPAGRLAECKLLIYAKIWKDRWQTAIIDSYDLNPELLSADDKIFIPGTVNRQAVPATINIYCTIKPNGLVTILM